MVYCVIMCLQQFGGMKLIFRTSEINRMKYISHCRSMVSINRKSSLRDKFLLKFNRLPPLPINQRQQLARCLTRYGRKHRVLVIVYLSPYIIFTLLTDVRCLYSESDVWLLTIKHIIRAKLLCVDTLKRQSNFKPTKYCRTQTLRPRDSAVPRLNFLRQEKLSSR